LTKGLPTGATAIEEASMEAHVGDRLILEGTHVGDHRRVGVVVEVRKGDGTPPYLVRWLDDQHESLVYPGVDARLETQPAG
jgi:Domain of unknown function (DUF1918)